MSSYVHTIHNYTQYIYYIPKYYRFDKHERKTRHKKHKNDNATDDVHLLDGGVREYPRNEYLNQ